MTKRKRVAIVYDRVNKWGGAERVLLTLRELFPNATLFTSVYDDKRAPWARVFKKVQPSFLQHVPFAKNNHEYLAPLMPMAFESFNFNDFDLVISVTSEAAKGIITPPHVEHICYCLTPTRYLWSGRSDYFANRFAQALSAPMTNYLRRWDTVASTRPDHMIGISTEVTNRIQKYYGRDSIRLFPPVDTKAFSGRRRDPQDYFLIVSRLVRYKKVDLAIQAFNKLPYTLLIVGTGREEKRLKRMAKKNIYFLGRVEDEDLGKLYSGARAVIFPQREDFGIVAVEAQSAGVPVIAYKKGGAADMVIPGITGVFFNKQTVMSLTNAVKIFHRMRFNHLKARENALQFSKERFLEEFGRIVSTL